MALVNISSIQVLDNPSLFTSQFQFEITFECIAPLKHGKGCGNENIQSSLPGELEICSLVQVLSRQHQALVQI